METDTGAEQGVLLGGGALRHAQTGEFHHHLVRLPLHHGGIPEHLPLSLLAHGLPPSPHDDALVVLFEKRGPEACVVDLRAGVVAQTLHAGRGRQFYGRGVFSKDGSLLYCVAYRHEVYTAARRRHPERWTGQTRSWTRPTTVILNPSRSSKSATHE